MDFYETLDQVIDLLKQRGRMTYRTLRRQFALDDETLEDLKDELLFSHPVVDEDGRGLVWTGGTEEPLATTSQLNQPEPEPIVEQVQPVQATSSPVAPHTPEAERRQLTVMFCDLVDSTKLSSQLDPEDYREVVRAYQTICSDVIERFGCHIAQTLGDGLLIYSGYPVAHENDAERAVRTGLGILDAMKMLNERLERDKDFPLAVRVGIHTGPVVVGEVGAGTRQEQLALGETPNIAARIQGLAQPDTVIISDATYHLIQGYFHCETIGERELRGVAEPVVIYRVIQESGAQSRLDVAGDTGLTPLVGREQEVALLLERWAQVKDGSGQVVLLSGEAGIGKSRLVQVLTEEAATESQVWLTPCQCSPYYQNSALYPMIDLLERVTLRFGREESPQQKLSKLEGFLVQSGLPLSEALPLLATLLSLPLPEVYAPLTMSPEQQKQQTLQALLTILLRISTQQPVLFVMEDLHWVDPSTLEFLSFLVDQGPTARILALFTFRPDFIPPWTGCSHLTQITVNRLPHRQSVEVIQQVAHGKSLPSEVVEQIVAKTDGVPLFVEELTKMVLESGLLQERDDCYTLTGPLPPLAIPTTLHDSLMARLDRLTTVKVVAQLGATIGRTFAYDLLQAVAPLDEATLQQGLRQLVEAELVYQRGVLPQATYTFKHALIQDTAYQSLLKSTRQQYHQRIAQVLEVQFPDIAETQPELVAQHYTAAGCTEQAIVYWQRAGQHASDHSAHVEAVSHFTTGIALLTTLPETPERTQQALSLHIALGAALQMTKGNAAPEVERVYTRARELCQQVGETPELVPVLFGLWRFYVTQSHLRTARELGETLLRLAQRTDDPVLAVVGHIAMGATSLFLGEMPAARRHLIEGFARYTPDQRRAQVSRTGQDLGVTCQAYAAWTLWLLGYPEQAWALMHDAVALAHELSHPYSTAYGQCWAAIVAQFRRDVPAVYERAEAAVELSTERGFTVLAAMGACVRGWALVMQGQGQEGIRQARWAITALQDTGAALFVPYFCAVRADVAAHLGHPADGFQALAEAFTLMEQHEERYWEAEICRLRGVVLLRQTGTSPAEAETWLQRALDVARRQEAKSLELRAAMSLARLWQSQDKRQDAYDLLAPVYNWFTEGFDTADLQEAKALLEELA